MIDRFSHSGLSSYEKCPTQFRIRYIDRVRKQDEGIEAFMGKRVHESLEFLYNKILTGQTPLLDTVLDKYDALWTEQWHDRIAIVKREISIGQIRQIGEACLARYYRNQHPFETPVIHNELDMKFSIDPDGTYKIRGIVDRVDQVADGHYEIHDYKTSSRAMSQNEANKDRQLALYHIGLTKIFPDVQKVKLIWHFLRQGIRREVVKSAADLDKLIDKIKALSDTIRKKENSGGQFPAKESILCNWCYYWEECPAKNGSNPYVG